MKRHQTHNQQGYELWKQKNEYNNVPLSVYFKTINKKGEGREI